MMKNRKAAHITLHGKPLCECEMHSAGLFGFASPIPPEHRFCSFESIAAARRAKLEMQKYRYGLKIVVGMCPA